MRKFFLCIIVGLAFCSLQSKSLQRVSSYFDYMRALSDLSKKNLVYKDAFDTCNNLPLSEKTSSGCERALTSKVVLDITKYLNDNFYNKNSVNR